MLKNQMGYENEEDVKNCCVNIVTELMQYNLCFIDFENETHLGVYYTHEDFTERFVLLSKKYIVSISIVYEQDILIDVEDQSGYS